MNQYKDYTQQVRKRSLQVLNIIIGDNISPKLHHYIKILDNLKLKDGSLQEYYGELKRTVNSFIINWTEVMNNAIKEADKVTKVVNKQELMCSVEKTIDMQKVKQTDFEKSLLPITRPEEKVAYDEILALYNKYMEDLEEIKISVCNMRDLETMESFSRDQIVISLRKKNNTFVFTHTYIAMMLAGHIKEIRTSLEDIEQRIRNNLRSLEKERNEKLTNLLNQLYNKNKEHLAVSRRPRRNSSEIAEVRLQVQRCMDKLKNEIEYHKEVILTRLKEEAGYWSEKLKEFNGIATTIEDLEEVGQKVLEQQQTYVVLRETRIPKSKLKCWEHLERVFNIKLERLDEKKKEAARALVSFFSVRGPDRIFYNDDIGRYYVDEHGHQVYFYDYGLNMYHVNCNGGFFKARDTEAYYYDTHGRYVVDENGDKLYKIAPCSSSYRLVDDMFTKCTIDCGHSERPNKHCRMDIKEHNQNVLLPKVEKMDIKGILGKETALYLWDSFGHVLPEVLYEVASEQPQNPIHYLAHKLLRYKYNKSLTEMQQKKSEAANYRAVIYQDRKDTLIAASKVWKARQVKRRKPEESDASDDFAAYGAHIARQEFIDNLATFYG